MSTVVNKNISSHSIVIPHKLDGPTTATVHLVMIIISLKVISCDWTCPMCYISPVFPPSAWSCLVILDALACCHIFSGNFKIMFTSGSLLFLFTSNKYFVPHQLSSFPTSLPTPPYILVYGHFDFIIRANEQWAPIWLVVFGPLSDPYPYYSS